MTGEPLPGFYAFLVEAWPVGSSQQERESVQSYASVARTRAEALEQARAVLPGMECDAPNFPPYGEAVIVFEKLQPGDVRRIS